MGISAACVGGNMPWEQQQEIYDSIYHNPNSIKVRLRGCEEGTSNGIIPGRNVCQDWYVYIYMMVASRDQGMRGISWQGWMQLVLSVLA